MPEWMDIPALPPDNPERMVSLDRYGFAAAVLNGKCVLDCACGMGYGTAILAANGCSVAGVDIDTAAVLLAQQRYPGLEFSEGNIYRLDTSGFDALVSFETLEHLDWPEDVIDRLTVSEIVASVPIRPTVGWNPWHRRDFTPETFRALIERRFRVVAEFQQMWPDGKPLYMVIHGRTE